MRFTYLIFFEMLIFLFLVSRFGFFAVFAGYFLTSGLGILICSFSIRKLAGFKSQGMNSIISLMDKSLFVVSGIFLALPSFFTKVVGLLLCVPGLRWLIVASLKRYAKVVTPGNIRFGGSFAGQPFENQQSAGPFSDNPFADHPEGRGQDDLAQSEEVIEVAWKEIRDVTPDRKPNSNQNS